MNGEKTQKVSSIIPEHVHHTRITTYEEYAKKIDIITSDVGYNLSFIIGKKGNGKTSAFERILKQYEIVVPERRGDDDDSSGDDAADGDDTSVDEEAQNDAPIAYLNNAASGVGLYQWAYDNRDKKVLILDDVRKLFKEDDAVTILMALCNTTAPKRVHWRKQNKQLANDGVPPSFTTSSRMVIISNTIDGIVERLEPLLDRGRTFFFDPSVDELHHNWAKNWSDPEVWEFIGRHLDECPYPSGRWYFHAAEEKRVNSTGWKKELLEVWRSTDPERGLFIEVQNDPKFLTERQRIDAFKRLGNQRNLPSSRPTYFRWKNEYPHLVRPLPSSTTSDHTSISSDITSKTTPSVVAEQVQVTVEQMVDSTVAEVSVKSHKRSAPAKKQVLVATGKEVI